MKHSEKSPESLREILIDAIWEYSGDEYENSQDVIELAKESDEQLATRVVDLLSYYHENAN